MKKSQVLNQVLNPVLILTQNNLCVAKNVGNPVRWVALFFLLRYIGYAEVDMKVFWSIFLAVFTLLCGLFVFQNQSRSLSLDTNGHRLSFDLGFWGVAATDMNFTLLVAITFIVGVVFGLLVPTMIKDLLKK